MWLGNERENNSGPSSLVPGRMPRPILRYATHVSATNTVPFPNAQKENPARGRIFPSPLPLFLGDGFEGISRSFFPLSSLEQRVTLVPLSKKCLEPASCYCYYINLDRETALNHYYTFILFVCLFVWDLLKKLAQTVMNETYWYETFLLFRIVLARGRNVSRGSCETCILGEKGEGVGDAEYAG